MYDYLIVGSGLFGATFAHQATAAGKSCLVIDKREHLGGNVHCTDHDGITVHDYGAHIFHTNDQDIWDFVNRFTKFNSYIHTVQALWENQLYSLPFNMHTFYKLWGTRLPRDAQLSLEFDKISQRPEKIKQQRSPLNLEDQALSMVGPNIYSRFIKEYTEKQWQKDCRDLPAFIIKRLPVRFTYDNRYFTDRFQGVPIGGYNSLVNGLLKGSRIALGLDFTRQRETFNQVAKKVVFTGSIDEYYGYRFGVLQYRSLRFDLQRFSVPNWQGCPVINYTQKKVTYTRTIEHKHFDIDRKNEGGFSMVTFEYPESWEQGKERYYPINDRENDLMFSKYKELAKMDQDVIFGGRLAEYRYYDMHQVIASALKCARDELK